MLLIHVILYVRHVMFSSKSVHKKYVMCAFQSPMVKCLNLNILIQWSVETDTPRNIMSTFLQAFQVLTMAAVDWTREEQEEMVSMLEACMMPILKNQN